MERLLIEMNVYIVLITALIFISAVIGYIEKMFWRKKITSDEYADLNAKLIKLSTDVLILQATVEKMEIRVKTYHSKLSRIKNEEEEETQENNQPVDMADLQRRLLGLS